MALAKLSYLWAECAVDHGPCWRGPGRQHRAERRQGQAGRPGEFRPYRQQQRAAFADTVGDVAEIGGGQQAAVLEAVEDDQVEAVELVEEQLAHRKGDQRQFVQRGLIVFFRWPQNGEMHQIHRWIGFQQTAPGAFAGMRFTGNQQHAQPVAHAVDLDYRAVVLGGDLSGQRLRR